MIDAFYAGYDTIDPSDFDYVCKLDLDLDLPPRYFELLMERMEDRPAPRHVQRQAVLPHAPRPARQRGVRRRELGRHDQVLSDRRASGRSAGSSAS